MYILTTEKKINGAVAMLYPDLLEQIGERCQGDFIILPSSIHELILMKNNRELSIEGLQQLVIEVNLSQVAPEERLSNQVYAYNTKEHSLVMLTTPEQTKELMEQQMISQLQYSEMDEEWEGFGER